MRTAFLSGLALCALFLPAAARAADGTDSVLVLPVVDYSDQREDAFQAAERLERVLRNQGRHVEAPRRAREIFLSRHSRDPADVSAERVRRVVREAEEALEALNRGDEAKFVRHLQQAEGLVGGALEVFVRREPERLHQLCMLDIRNSLFAGNREEADRKATACDARFPGYRPVDPNPPDVERFMNHARKRRENSDVAPLVVRSTSSESCDVLVGGGLLGRTPFRQPHPPRGKRTIQLVCNGSPGRIYAAHTGPEPVVVEVDADLDRLLNTRRGERMYFVRGTDDPDEDLERIKPVSLQVAETIGASTVLLISPLAGGRTQLHAVTPRSIAAVELGPTLDDRELADAVESVTRRSSALVAHGRTYSSHPARRRLWLKALGFGSLAASAGLFVAASASYSRHRQDGVEFRTEPASIIRANEWLDSRAEPYVYAGIGATVAMAGGDLLFHPIAERSWSWYVSGASGLMGVILATYGLKEVVRGGPCDPSAQQSGVLASCVLDGERLDRGALLLMAAAPLLQLPLFHGVLFWRKRRWSNEVNLSARVGNGLLGVALHGSY